MAKMRTGGIQATFDAVKVKIEDAAESGVRDRLEAIADYAIYNSGAIDTVDTGAYITSFSIGKAGFGGGRSRKSDNKPRNQNPQQKADEARGQLQSDINSLAIKEDLESGNARFTIRNRAPHARTVEDGSNWKRNGYHIFTKIRGRFS